MFIHERKDWPHFKWDQKGLLEELAEVRYLQGRLMGSMDGLGFQLREEAVLQTLTQDVLKTSEIEGEKLDTTQVRSSIARHLGMDIGALLPVDRNVEGIVEVMIDATRFYKKPLTKDRLFDWHAALFPTGRSGMRRITVGSWRPVESDPMQVVSGPIGRERVHFEAPAHDRLKQEMSAFLNWFNASSETDFVIQSALAHFWFVTIHPFDDGNGRIARAIADMMLSRSENSMQRFYSMSAQIQREKNEYYDVLEQCQKGSLDITPWIKWYLECLKHAIQASETIMQNVLAKAEFWRVHAGSSFNDRQRKVLNRLMNQFEGKLTSSKWAKLAKCSQDTASRDINDLVSRGILVKSKAEGRSTSYELVLPDFG
jgi:Fic family protein